MLHEVFRSSRSETLKITLHMPHLPIFSSFPDVDRPRNRDPAGHRPSSTCSVTGSDADYPQNSTVATRW